MVNSHALDPSVYQQFIIVKSFVIIIIWSKKKYGIGKQQLWTKSQKNRSEKNQQIEKKDFFIQKSEKSMDYMT